MTISVLSAAFTACEVAGWELTNLELQKLLYLAHRTYLGRMDGEPLIDEDFEAWNYGPVVPSLYRLARGYGSEAIEMLPPVRRTRARPEHEVTREVVRHFEGWSPGQLVDLTHAPGGAWDLNYVAGQRHRVIPDRDILAEYRRLRDRAA